MRAVLRAHALARPDCVDQKILQEVILLHSAIVHQGVDGGITFLSSACENVCDSQRYDQSFLFSFLILSNLPTGSSQPIFSMRTRGSMEREIANLRVSVSWTDTQKGTDRLTLTFRNIKFLNVFVIGEIVV